MNREKGERRSFSERSHYQRHELRRKVFRPLLADTAGYPYTHAIPTVRIVVMIQFAPFPSPSCRSLYPSPNSQLSHNQEILTSASLETQLDKADLRVAPLVDSTLEQVRLCALHLGDNGDGRRGADVRPGGSGGRPRCRCRYRRGGRGGGHALRCDDSGSASHRGSGCADRPENGQEGGVLEHGDLHLLLEVEKKNKRKEEGDAGDAGDGIVLCCTTHTHTTIDIPGVVVPVN